MQSLLRDLHQQWESLTERGVDVGPAEGTEEEQNEGWEEGGGLVGEEDDK